MHKDPFADSGMPVVNPWHVRLRELHYQEPFHPYMIRTKDGKETIVRDPLHILFASVRDTIRVRRISGSKSVTKVIPVADVAEIYETSGSRPVHQDDQQGTGD